MPSFIHDELSQLQWHHAAMTIGTSLVGALVVLLVGLRLAKWIAGVVERALGRAHVEPTAALFLRKVTYVAGVVMVVLAVLQVIGVPLTSTFAVLGAAGLAIGLALKDSLSNIASGVMLVSLRPFRVGDVVTLGSGTGVVEAVSIFQTRLRGADNQTISIPNSVVTSAAIVNLTPDTRRRIELVIGIGYDDDIDEARATALEVMRADPRVLTEPAPDVLVYALGDSSVNLGIRCHAANADFFVTKCDLTEKIKKAFDRDGISIPFPQRDVHLSSTAARDVTAVTSPGRADTAPRPA